MSLKLKFDVILVEDFQAKSLSDLKSSINDRLVNLDTGDIVIISSFSRIKQKNEHITDAMFYFVYSERSDKKLIKLKKAPNDTYTIPKEAAKAITVCKPGLDFVKSYSNIYNIGLKEYRNCFKSIELDYDSHFEQLPDGIKLDNTLKIHSGIFYFFEEPLDSNNNTNLIKLNENFYASIDHDQLDEKMQDLEIDLNVEADEEALNENDGEKTSQVLKDVVIPENERDPEVEDFARQFRKIYENNFIQFLKSLKPDATLNATSLPTKKYNKDTYEEDSAESTSLVFYFEKLELDELGNVNILVANSFDKKEKCFFTPFLCQDYGPYFRTNLLCSYYNIGRSKDKEAMNFFLDLPIDLYNLIE